MIRPIPFMAALAGVAALGGCASDDALYPSLARRPAERISGTAEVVAPSAAPALPPAPPSAELAARLRQLVERARAAHGQFLAHRGHAEQLVAAARSAAVASEAWSVATVAVADLESLRSEAMIALADLDALHASTTIAAAGNGSVADAEAVTAARDQVIVLVAQEDAALSQLRGGLRS